jgi:hypothetical protein
MQGEKTVGNILEKCRRITIFEIDGSDDTHTVHRFLRRVSQLQAMGQLAEDDFEFCVGMWKGTPSASYAINTDKLSFVAPSLSGQEEVLQLELSDGNWEAFIARPEVLQAAEWDAEPFSASYVVAMCGPGHESRVSFDALDGWTYFTTSRTYLAVIDTREG